MDEEKKRQETEEVSDLNESKMQLEDQRRLASPWLCHLLKGPLWPTEGNTRGNDVYGILFPFLFLCLLL